MVTRVTIRTMTTIRLMPMTKATFIPINTAP